MNKKYERICPECGSLIIYTKNKFLWQAIRRNSLCWNCRNKLLSASKMGEKNPMYGKHFSEEAKRKQSELRVGKRPYVMTDEIRKKIGLSGKGKIPWNKGLTGVQIVWNKGRKATEEERRKNRISQLKRLEKFKIPACIDIGANEFFAALNSKGFNFINKTFMNIGYVADGYDEEKHIWIEFDTPYHRDRYHQKKDIIRQENIIKYFESINNPLKSFVRVKADNNGNILETRCVYGEKMKIFYPT
jgi:hypothetical protein